MPAPAAPRGGLASGVPARAACRSRRRRSGRVLRSCEPGSPEDAPRARSARLPALDGGRRVAFVARDRCRSEPHAGDGEPGHGLPLGLAPEAGKGSRRFAPRLAAARAPGASRGPGRVVASASCRGPLEAQLRDQRELDRVERDRRPTGGSVPRWGDPGAGCGPDPPAAPRANGAGAPRRPRPGSRPRRPRRRPTGTSALTRGQFTARFLRRVESRR